MHQFLKNGILTITWVGLGVGCEHPKGFDTQDDTERRLSVVEDPTALVNTKAIRPPLPGAERLARLVELDSELVDPYAHGYPTRGVEVYVPINTVVGSGWVTVWEWDATTWTHIPPG